MSTPLISNYKNANRNISGALSTSTSPSDTRLCKDPASLLRTRVSLTGTARASLKPKPLRPHPDFSPLLISHLTSTQTASSGAISISFLFFLQAPRKLRLPRLPFFTKWKKKNPSPPPPPHIKGLPLHRRNPPQSPRPLPLPPQLPIRPSPKEGPPLSRLETTPITTPVHSSRYL